MPDKTKILVISHGHPDNAKGGGEIAAYNLHNKLNETADYHSVFLARHDRDELLHPGTLLSGSGRDNEILLHSTRNDYFLHSQHNKVLIAREFRQVLERVNPKIVHFHHFVHLGLEMIREARAFNPDLKIVFTLHEYIAICNNSGQMMTTKNTLCYESTPQACVKCFPQHTPQDFLMRKLFFQSHFDLVDEFVSPSHFLKSRYVDWGIPAEKISVIENMLDDTKYEAKETPPISWAQSHSLVSRSTEQCEDTEKLQKPKRDKRSKRKSEKVRFSFYGQINWFKGLDVLLNAIQQLPQDIRDQVRLDINGTGLENQPQQLQDQINHLIGSMLDVVNLRGAYTQAELSSLMSESHWMIIPSKWWENSPMVILEARKHGLPIICSDIGGMKEKIDDEVTGLHFQAGRADALAAAITRAVKNPKEQIAFAQAIKNSYKDGEAFTQHIDLYENLLKVRSNYHEGKKPEIIKIHPENGTTQRSKTSNAA